MYIDTVYLLLTMSWVLLGFSAVTGSAEQTISQSSMCDVLAKNRSSENGT